MTSDLSAGRQAPWRRIRAPRVPRTPRRNKRHSENHSRHIPKHHTIPRRSSPRHIGRTPQGHRRKTFPRQQHQRDHHSGNPTAVCSQTSRGYKHHLDPVAMGLGLGSPRQPSGPHSCLRPRLCLRTMGVFNNRSSLTPLTARMMPHPHRLPTGTSPSRNMAPASHTTATCSRGCREKLAGMARPFRTTQGYQPSSAGMAPAPHMTADCSLNRIGMALTPLTTTGVFRLLLMTIEADSSGARHTSRCSSHPQHSGQCQVIIHPGQLLLAPLLLAAPALT